MFCKKVKEIVTTFENKVEVHSGYYGPNKVYIRGPLPPELPTKSVTETFNIGECTLRIVTASNEEIIKTICGEIWGSFLRGSDIVNDYYQGLYSHTGPSLTFPTVRTGLDLAKTFLKNDERYIFEKLIEEGSSTKRNFKSQDLLHSAEIISSSDVFKEHTYLTLDEDHLNAKEFKLHISSEYGYESKSWRWIGLR